MAISSNSLIQTAHYQQSESHFRKISLANKVPSKQSLSNESSNKQAAELTLKQLGSSLASGLNSPHRSNITDSSNNVKAIEEENNTYDKPLPPKVALIRMILAGVFGKDFEDDVGELAFEHANSPPQQSSTIQTLQIGVFQSADTEISAQNENSVDIDGLSFNAGDVLSVTQWQHQQQSLSYQVSGQFDLNGSSYDVNYALDLTSEFTFSQSFEITAAALKDPLIVQFGAQGIGSIQGTRSFDLVDEKPNEQLPIFSGDVAYLVYDQNKNGVADNGSELFGPQSGSGFAELAELDSNQNGFIEKEDVAYQSLYLWQPALTKTEDEGKGANARGQWLSLSEAGIQAISTNAIATPFTFYDDTHQVAAQLQQSSFALSDSGQAYGVHHVDVRI